MNESVFIAAYGSYERTKPFTPENADTANRLRRTMQNAAGPEHAVTLEERTYGSDQAFCKCGWESEGYWDGFDIAERDWRNHVMQEIQGDEFP